MLYIMLYGKYPFDIPAAANMPKAREVLQMLDKMVNRKYEIYEKVKVSKECLDLLHQLLAPEPGERIKIEQITKHPWFLTNLPADAQSMNQRWLDTPFPPEHQSPDDIRQLLEQAKTKGVAYHYHENDDDLDKAIASAMQEVSIGTR